MFEVGVATSPGPRPSPGLPPSASPPRFPTSAGCALLLQLLRPVPSRNGNHCKSLVIPRWPGPPPKFRSTASTGDTFLLGSQMGFPWPVHSWTLPSSRASRFTLTQTGQAGRGCVSSCPHFTEEAAETQRAKEPAPAPPESWLSSAVLVPQAFIEHLLGAGSSVLESKEGERCA